jgi:hypothetical protein
VLGVKGSFEDAAIPVSNLLNGAPLSFGVAAPELAAPSVSSLAMELLDGFVSVLVRLVTCHLAPTFLLENFELAVLAGWAGLVINNDGGTGIKESKVTSNSTSVKEIVCYHKIGSLAALNGYFTSPSTRSDKNSSFASAN